MKQRIETTNQTQSSLFQNLFIYLSSTCFCILKGSRQSEAQGTQWKAKQALSLPQGAEVQMNQVSNATVNYSAGFVISAIKELDEDLGEGSEALAWATKFQEFQKKRQKDRDFN